MYLSFGLFFFWRKSGTVVVVGVPDVFFALRVDWLFDFFEEREKAMCQLCVWTAKSVTEKNNSREDCAEGGIKTVQAPLRQAQRPFGLLTWR